MWWSCMTGNPVTHTHRPSHTFKYNFGNEIGIPCLPHVHACISIHIYIYMHACMGFHHHRACKLILYINMYHKSVFDFE